MSIFPLLVLDEQDMKPFIDLYKKQLKQTDVDFKITSIIPVALPDGGWNIEIKAEPIAKQLEEVDSELDKIKDEEEQE